MANRSFKERTPFEEPTINLTPLIDVVFVILIMFILVAPLLQLDKVRLAEGPEIAFKEASSVRESSPIAIHVRRDNTIWLKERSIAKEEIRPALSSLKLAHPGAIPQLFLDQEASFGTYQAVKNGVEEAGFQEMDILLTPK